MPPPPSALSPTNVVPADAVLLLALGGLGAFAIGVGSDLRRSAANWAIYRVSSSYSPCWGSSVPMPTGWCGRAAAHTVGSQTPWPGYFALTLASIALVGQTYQLRGEPYQALLLWLLAGSPALWLAEGAFAALVFLGALAVTGAFSFDPLVDLLGHDPQARILVSAGLGSAAGIWPAAGGQPADPAAPRPAFAAMYERLGWACSCWQRAAACTCGISPWTPTTYVRRG